MTTLTYQIHLPRDQYQINDVPKIDPLKWFDGLLMKTIWILMILNGLLLIIHLPKFFFHLLLEVDMYKIQGSYYLFEWAVGIVSGLIFNGKVML